MDTKQKSWWLYVLKLEQEKYYVGITSKTPEERMREHISGYMGAKWTKKYRPQELLDKKLIGAVDVEEAKKYENKVTREYINRFGTKNVRGGNLSYPGGIYKIKDVYIQGWQIEYLSTALLFILLAIYIFWTLFAK